MKPRNFPGRKRFRQIMAQWREGRDLTPAEREFCCSPRDVRIRMGRDAQKARLLNGY